MTDAVDLYWRRFCYVTEHYARQLTQGRGYVRVDAPLTRDIVRAHLAGELTLSLYLLDAADRCTFGVLDHDNYRTWTDAQGRAHRSPEEGVSCLQGMRERLAQQGIEAALETSRRGAHLWVFATEPVAAREMRALLHWAADGHEVEMYPKQEHRGSGVGSNIRAPLGIHQASGVGTTFGWMLVHNGELPSVRPGRRVLVPRAALERLVSGQERQAAV